MTMQKFFAAMKEVSILGLKVELLNEQTLGSEVFTFLPSLSSLYLAYNKPLPVEKESRQKLTKTRKEKATAGSDNGLIKCSKLPAQGHLDASSVDYVAE